MSATTPGPWVFVDEQYIEAPTFFERDRVTGELSTEPLVVAEVISIPEHLEGDGRLLAAAPRLLEACRRAIPYLRDLVARTAGEFAHGVGDAGDRMALDACEAAVAEAEEP